MAERPPDAWEAGLRREALAFAYPPTPDIAGAVSRRLETPRTRPPSVRRFALAALAILLLAAAALAVPGVRAAVLEWLQIGAIRLRLEEAPPTLPAATPRPPAGLGPTLTLAEASVRADFPLRLPAADLGLGPPDEVFLSEASGPEGRGQVVVLVWHVPDRPDVVRLSLYQIGVRFFGIKTAASASVRQARVGAYEAFWVPGPHPLQLAEGGENAWTLVPGNVLIWADDVVTYRLESDLTLEEALRLARSLEPVLAPR